MHARRRRRSPFPVLVAALVAALIGAAPRARAEGAAGDTLAAGAPARVLTLRRVEFSGLGKTSPPIALRAADLPVPAPVSPEAIAAATERLRASGLFRSVEAHTRAGDVPGDVVLVFVVRENGPHLRTGLGYEDDASWYLIPLQLDAGNFTGRGDRLTLGARFGYRVAGLDLALRHPAARAGGTWWQLRASGEGVDRVYFWDSTETRHHLSRGQLELRAGRRVSRSFALEGWLASRTTNVDSNASVYTDRASLGRHRGDDLPFATLPSTIQRDVRATRQGRLGLALTLDRRTGSGLETRGAWARLGAEGVTSRDARYGAWQADVRAFAPIAPGVQLAARVRGAAVSSEAPFWDRLYAGGFTTVRGFPSEALSPPQGDLDLATASLELRHAWIGGPANPRLTAIAFVDAGHGWSWGTPRLADFASGAGVGFRLRLPWVGPVGLDAARPLSRSPVHEGFHLNASLGWTF